jgi:hypothetical protein
MAAIENATAIWEYDPTLPSNSVLGGFLDIIAAIRTLAIKVFHSLLINISFLQVPTHRSNHLVNELSTSRNVRSSAALPTLSRSLFTAIPVGGRPTEC